MYDVTAPPGETGNLYPASPPPATAAEAPEAKAAAAVKAYFASSEKSAKAPLPPTAAQIEAKAVETKLAAQPWPKPTDVVPEAHPEPGEPFQLAVPEDLPLEYHGDPEITAALGGFAEAMRGTGLQKDSAELLLNSYIDAQRAAPYTGNFTVEDAEHVLKITWGESYSENLAKVQALTTKLGEGFKMFLDTSGFGNSPPALQALLEFSELLTLAPEQIESQMKAIMSSKQWAAGDKATLRRLQTLHRVRYPS
jgi:hypothetical protein